MSCTVPFQLKALIDESIAADTPKVELKSGGFKFKAMYHHLGGFSPAAGVVIYVYTLFVNATNQVRRWINFT